MGSIPRDCSARRREESKRLAQRESASGGGALWPVKWGNVKGILSKFDVTIELVRLKFYCDSGVNSLECGELG